MKRVILLMIAFVAAGSGVIVQAASALNNVHLSNEQLLSRVAIEALAVEYFYLLDHGQADKLADLYTDDAVLDRGDGQVLVGRAAIAKYYASRSTKNITRHVTTNLRLVFETDNRVRGIRTFTHYSGPAAEQAPPAIPSVAEYEEVFVRGADRQWRFASRKITSLFSTRE